MKSDIQKIRDRINEIETNILAGSNLSNIQRGCQNRIWKLCDQVDEILNIMEEKKKDGSRAEALSRLYGEGENKLEREGS